MFRIESRSVIVLITFAGVPAANELGGMSLVTTLPAPITQLSPIVTPGPKNYIKTVDF